MNLRPLRCRLSLLTPVKQRERFIRPGNGLPAALIWKQRPDASYVGGFNTWLKCGRYVRKGEKGIAILAPMFFKDKRQMPYGSEGEFKRIWFKVVYVFALSKTDGTPLPELPTKSTGERGEDMLTHLLKFAASRGITVRFVEQCCPKLDNPIEALSGVAEKSSGGAGTRKLSAAARARIAAAQRKR